MNAVLFYTFLIIFIATAVLTLLSLPNWVIIPENYKKVLFSSLIIEVVGCVVLLFKQEIQFTYNVKPNSNWIALSTTDGSLVQPSIQVFDSTFILGEYVNNNIPNLAGHSMKIKLEGAEMLALNRDGIVLGKITDVNLQELGLFNRLEAWKNEIPDSEEYKIIKFNFDRSLNSWVQKGKSAADSLVGIEVFSTPEIGYKIVNLKTNKEVFNSMNVSMDVIHRDRRKLHFIQLENAFYLIRITQADLNKRNEEFIHFMLVKLKPQLEL